MGKKRLHINNLEAFLAEAKVNANYKKDLDFIMDTYELTQADMSRLFGINQSTVCRWLRGEMKPKCLILIHSTAENLRKQLQK
jgi:DNA-binding transcriptional regulator YiaG